MNDKKIKHLEMIQGIISRMSANSFFLKGWTVTLVAGIFALASKDADKRYFLITYVPVLVFWCLDAYYLRQERLYRALYNSVRDKSEEEIDFDMDTTLLQIQTSKTTYFNTFWSVTEVIFYFPLAILSIIIIVITNIPLN